MVRFSSNLLVLGATQLAFYALVSASPVGSGNVEPTKVQGRQEATKIIQNQNIVTPTPTQGGMVDNCDTFHYVLAGEKCKDIAARFYISLDDFLRWNPAAGDECLSLWANTFACVGVTAGNKEEL